MNPNLLRHTVPYIELQANFSVPHNKAEACKLCDKFSFEETGEIRAGENVTNFPDPCFRFQLESRIFAVAAVMYS